MTRLEPLIEAHAEIVLVDLGDYTDLSQVEAEFAVVLGGDGAILRAAKQMGLSAVAGNRREFGQVGFSG